MSPETNKLRPQAPNFRDAVEAYADILSNARVPEADIDRITGEVSQIKNAKTQERFAHTVEKVKGAPFTPTSLPTFSEVNACGLSWKARKLYKEQGTTIRDLEFSPTDTIFQERS